MVTTSSYLTGTNQQPPNILIFPVLPATLAIAHHIPNYPSAEKIERKQRFIRLTTDALQLGEQKQRMIIIGDMNVLEPDHQPRYRFSQDWEYGFYKHLSSMGHDAYRLSNGAAMEYSWVGRTGDGYRYDHAFISQNIRPNITRCGYIHETRTRA